MKETKIVLLKAIKKFLETCMSRFLIYNCTSVPNFEVEKRPVGLFCPVGYIRHIGVYSNRFVGQKADMSV